MIKIHSKTSRNNVYLKTIVVLFFLSGIISSLFGVKLLSLFFLILFAWQSYRLALWSKNKIESLDLKGPLIIFNLNAKSIETSINKVEVIRYMNNDSNNFIFRFNDTKLYFKSKKIDIDILENYLIENNISTIKKKKSYILNVLTFLEIFTIWN